MSPAFVSRAKKLGVPMLSLFVILGAYGLVGVEHPSATADERQSLADAFAFEGHELPTAPGLPVLTVDDMRLHPAVDHMRAWVAGAGTGAALGDLTGDGLANDLCFADTRTDSVTVRPVPGTGDRFEPTVLRPPARDVDQPWEFPTGCIIADLNEDGMADVVVYYTTRPPVVFLQTSDGFVAQELVPDAADEIWTTAAGIVTDLDGDGHLDLVFGNYFPDGSRFYDPDDDSDIEVNDSLSNARNGGTTEFLVFESATQGDDPSVTFRRVRDVLPKDVSQGWTLAIAAVDLNGNLLPELYFANDFGKDRLLLNRSTPGELAFELLEGRRGFTTPKSRVLGKGSFKGMGADVADIDGNGLFDIAVSNITSHFAFQESNFTFINTGDVDGMERGIAPFVDRSEELGLARSGFSWDTRFGDFNNDGTVELLQATGFIKGEKDQYPELHETALANEDLIRNPAFWAVYDGQHDLAGHEPNRFWVRGDDGRFVDIGRELGVTTDEVTRGIASGDVNGNGLLDFVFANHWEPSVFYENVCSTCGESVALQLRLPLEDTDEAAVTQGHALPDTPSRAAVGAHVRLERPDGTTQVGYVDASNGHSGKRAPIVHFGLGDVDADLPLTAHLTYRDAGGTPREERIELTPGWHTVLLPSTTDEE
jgi:enediyne biosynthesis protein E4